MYVCVYARICKLLMKEITNLITAGNGLASLRNIKVCISFDKSHMSHLNIGWDGVRTYITYLCVLYMQEPC